MVFVLGVCGDLEHDVPEWSTCGFDYNQFNRIKKDTLEGIRRLFDHPSFTCFWYNFHLAIVADHSKPWLKDCENIKINNRRIEISKKTQ